MTTPIALNGDGPLRKTANALRRSPATDVAVSLEEAGFNPRPSNVNSLREALEGLEDPEQEQQQDQSPQPQQPAKQAPPKKQRAVDPSQGHGGQTSPHRNSDPLLNALMITINKR